MDTRLRIQMSGRIAVAAAIIVALVTPAAPAALAQGPGGGGMGGGGCGGGCGGGGGGGGCGGMGGGMFPAPEVNQNLATLKMIPMMDQSNLVAFLKTLSDGFFKR